MFKEVSEPDNFQRYLALKRATFSEDDLSELIKNELFLACVDAFRRQLITGGEAMQMMFPDLKDIPRDLSLGAYLSLQIEVAQRIQDGRLSLPPNLPDRYPTVYRQGANDQPK